MTPEEINKAIAEQCGYEDVTVCQMTGRLIGSSGVYAMVFAPSYVEDLNACADMEATLSVFERTTYPMEIRKIVVRDAEGKENPDTGTLDDTHFYGAKAPQRCEAFLRTKGLWVEQTEKCPIAELITKPLTIK